MRSMTGFGVGEGALGSGKVVVEVRTVNHRFLDVRCRLPKELADSGLFVEQLVRSRLTRGRCELGVRLEGALAPVELDTARAHAAMLAFSRLRDELCPGAEIPLSLLAAVPDLFSAVSEQELPHLRAATERAIYAALDDLEAMRSREGAALARDLMARAAKLRELLARIDERMPQALAHHRKRLSERTRALLSSTGVQLDEGRIEQELVLLADRTDISEELTRLQIHIEGVDELLRADEPTGRKLDFLLQEIGRELNTIGSKSQDATITKSVVEAKAELEKLREQVQNVE